MSNSKDDDAVAGPVPVAPVDAGPVLAADGTPLKRSLGRALRRQKGRALLLIAPLLIFVLVTFIIPIGSMLFRSVENDIVANTLPYAVQELASWDAASGELPSEAVYKAMYDDLFVATEAKKHTRLGSRLNYEQTGISSLFRQSGRKVDDLAKDAAKALEDAVPAFENGETWYALMDAGDGEGNTTLLKNTRGRIGRLNDGPASADMDFVPSAEIAALLPRTARTYTEWAIFEVTDAERVPTNRAPWELVSLALLEELKTADLSGLSGERAALLQQAQAVDFEIPSYTDTFAEIDQDWANVTAWETLQTHSAKYTAGYFLNAIDAQKTPDGFAWQPEEKQILLTLFGRTLVMSLMITGSCILLGYPVAWLLANLPASRANLLMILVLLPFWTSLLVRTSAWKVMLQSQGVINDVLVWIGLVDDADRLVMINNQFGTIVAMTHILLPFMILPMYSVMQTVPPTYLRAAKSLGATNWTAFWRVYFPQSIPGIGAGSILVFILSIGYYITPEIVGGTKGVFISNRIAYHISSSLNWGLAAALGSILLAVVLVLYWCYDRIVGIDNVKLG
ncbi:MULTISPECIES: ABC transporter permease [Roseobacteraceae]|uniref:Spermidine/putrescine transport system permease protein PotB n=1 Tax=Pseudosulfitobacter pseudonitzschiae TaxID=1402135 RepID=A0A221K4W0_9RHOB|nr:MULTISPECIES: ABC transporter permease [Roseobacteraceae]ASM74044.1 spermidine/putrescine transport system permease protein PotB [Pseudosulfitobacter pseudonitzschiae]